MTDEPKPKDQLCKTGFHKVGEFLGNGIVTILGKESPIPGRWNVYRCEKCSEVFSEPQYRTE